MFKRIFKLGCLAAIAILSESDAFSQTWNPAHKIGTSTGKYNFAYNQVPDQLVALFDAAIPNTGVTYQWEKSTKPLSGFTSISGATQTSYTFSSALASTTYYRRKSTKSGYYIYSNVIKITVVSTKWEDINYIREYDVATTGITSWTAVDQLAIGPKFQTTTYLDGLGRATQKISRETATPPADPNSLWGDMVQFSLYDAYGRQPINYLPYTTTSQSGKYKTAPLTEQPQYYSTNYNESFTYNSITFDNSPLNRVTNVKLPGTSWNASAGRSAAYDMNNTADEVMIFSAAYIQGSAPVLGGTYPEETLFKINTTDENGKAVIEFHDKEGKLILRKVQLDDTPSGPYAGWICTYNVYDDFGLLRYQIQPEGVNYLRQNNWSFTGTNGTTILNEQCFQYYYDDKGRTTWKKAPGAEPLRMLYDIRDRVVFMQDGNQAAMTTPQWTATIYDELDRPVISTLYNTTKTIAQLQTAINNATAGSTITINNAGTFSVTAKTYLNPLTSTDLNNSSVTTILNYQFYDNYSFNAVKAFNTNYTNLTAYNPGSDANVQPIAKTQRTTSMPTGSMTRVLGSTTFLSATHYYDERGSHIQTLEDNIKTGTDITTIQYHFDGRVLSTCNDHTVPNTGYTNYKTLSKYLFDKLGRVTSIQKQYGANAFKTIASYAYDDVGRLKKKILDPNYMAGGNTRLEELNFSYNIHNQITGINKDYALKTSGNYDKWNHFFGLYLGFDNRDNVFANANLTGQVTGLLWNTQGDDAQRKYDYAYDNAGRLVKADFKEKQHPGDAWSNSKMDFSINGTSGKITYDLNGNLLNMIQKGVLPGTTTPITVDNLSYTYGLYSNKLQNVTDNMTNTTVNGQFGDFKDGTNGSNPDYVYDANGNVVVDLNKNAKEIAGVTGANGIKYNFLDKPEEIRIAGKGVIKIVYSAGGEKLQRSFKSETEDKIKITTYINQYIYEEATTFAGAVISPLAVSNINFEEGRIRVVTPTSQGNGLDALIVDGNMDLPNAKRGAFDYFIMDYQQNVRMILTEEIHTASNTATMETSRAALEESIFGQTGAANEVATTRYTPVPAGWSGNTSSHVSRLGTNSGHNIGPNALQKVMAGDKVNATVLYYHQGSAGGNSNNFVTTVLSSLTQAISGGSAASNLVKGNASAITGNLGGITGFIDAVQPGGVNPPSTTPQAFLTILFFDERFNFIEATDGGVWQDPVLATVGSNGSSLTLANIKAPKNGYAYIYISNQSNNDVYFDDLQVGITTGNIIEENHYYAYGLKVATLSSKKLGDNFEGKLKNNYLYNGKELLDEDADLGWLDYGFRNYDPQIGRFMQLDPLAWNYPNMSSYQYAACDPIANIDINGLGPGDVLGHVGDAVVTAASFLEPVLLPLHKVATAGTKIGGLAKMARIGGLAVKTSNLLNTIFNTPSAGNKNSINMTTHLNCHSSVQSKNNPHPNDYYNTYGGIRFTGQGTGAWQPSRMEKNPDPESEDISLLMRSPGGLQGPEAPTKYTQMVESIVEYIKTQAEAMTSGEEIVEKFPFEKSKNESSQNQTSGKTETLPKSESKVKKYKIGTVVHSDVGNVTITSDSTRDYTPRRTATDTVPWLKKKN